MTNFNDFLAERKQDADFKKEYDALEPEFSIIQAMIDARKATGMTQKELAEKIHVNPNNICQWEIGRAEPSFDTLERLADLFGILPGDLINSVGEVSMSK